MDIPDEIFTIFTAEIEAGNVIRVPENEFDVGELGVGEKYRIAILPAVRGNGNQGNRMEVSETSLEPPVEEGDVRDVEIEGIGDQGDGIARVERGFVVIVPETEQGERVKIRITDVGTNVAFAEVVERYDRLE